MMKFAKFTFRFAGAWGMLVIVPMYFLYHEIGRKDPPALSHPHFYFGWLGVTLAWQVLFLMLAVDPVRYKPMMIPAMLEKLGYVLAVLVLAGMRRVGLSQAMTALPDAILFLLFAIAYVKTPAAREFDGRGH